MYGLEMLDCVDTSRLWAGGLWYASLLSCAIQKSFTTANQSVAHPIRQLRAELENELLEILYLLSSIRGWHGICLCYRGPRVHPKAIHSFSSSESSPQYLYSNDWPTPNPMAGFISPLALQEIHFSPLKQIRVNGRKHKVECAHINNRMHFTSSIPQISFTYFANE